MDDDLKLIWKPGPNHDSTMPGTMQCNLLFRGTLNYIKRLEKRDNELRIRKSSSRGSAVQAVEP